LSPNTSSSRRIFCGASPGLARLRLMKDKNYLDILFLVCVIKGCNGGGGGLSHRFQLSPYLRDERPLTFQDKARARLCRLTFALLSLALCVFAWGLQYKLSLYNPPNASIHQIPQAKLLSKDQWAPSPHDEHALDMKPISQPPTEQFFLLGVFLVLALGTQTFLIAPEKHREGCRPWLSWSSASLSAFFFRPPPSVLL
jgi:hypothetical protein